jgi:hypothetical protein
MPLLAGKRNIDVNISEMERAGHPRAQSIAAALHKAGVKRKGTTMAKHEGEKGMSPRKAMASGGGGSFGAEPYHEVFGGMGPHPDHTAHTGMDGAMGDGERGAPPAIHHTKGHLPAQAAPIHGPNHVNGYGDHARGGKV